MSHKKYQKPRNPNKRGTHNRPGYGSWSWCADKETAKANRKFMKALRHKLLFHIPLTDEEQKIVNAYKLTPDTGLDREGRPNRSYNYKTDTYEPNSGVSERYCYLNPKEIAKSLLTYPDAQNFLTYSEVK